MAEHLIIRGVFCGFATICALIVICCLAFAKMLLQLFDPKKLRKKGQTSQPRPALGPSARARLIPAAPIGVWGEAKLQGMAFGPECAGGMDWG